MASFNYVVTAHKSTAVTHSVVGNFTSPSDINLITAKFTRLEIHTLTPDGLQGILDVPIYGRIAALQLFRPKDEPKDLLFLLTEKYKFCVLEFSADGRELLTRAAGDVQDKIGRPVDNGMAAAIDPDCRMIALHLYDGMLKVIPISESGALCEAVNLRLEELSVVALAFLEGCARPTLALLHEDTKLARHVKTYEVSLKDKDLHEGPWSQSNLDGGAGLVIPVARPLGGALVVGEDVITYFGPAGRMRSVGIASTVITAWGRIDADRYLLGDYTGGLHLLVLSGDAKDAQPVVQPLGRTSVAHSLSYLDSGVVFVGSRQGDSQLVRLLPEAPDASEPGNFVEVLDRFTNLGPIVDFAVQDLERQGQGQLVSCSGVGADGSLRIVRNGIGINETATIELAGIKGIWNLRRSYTDVHDAALVLSFVGETRVLAINAEDELDEEEIEGFEAAVQTLYCGNTVHDQLLQVTGSSVRLVDCASRRLLATWQPPAGASINVAAASASQVLLSTGGGRLVYLEIGAGSLTEVSSTTLAQEVACLDISPIGDEGERAAYGVVGSWGLEVLLLSLPNLQHVTSEPLGGDVIPRSVLLALFDGLPHLLCGLGDGTLVTWQVDAMSGDLCERKKLSLGSKPLALRTFAANGASHVFAASDRPTVIYASNRKLLFSNLNENDVSFLASFNSASFPDSLAIAKEGCLMIGSIDDIQRLHIRTVPMYEQPRRIAHQPQNRVFGVITMGSMGRSGGDQHQLRIVDDQSFDTLASYPLERNEMGCSLASLTFSGEGTAYFVVGTALVQPDEPEPTKGRLLVLQYGGGRVALVAEKEVRGSAWTVRAFQGKLLAGVSNKVSVFRWLVSEAGGHELLLEASHASGVLALYLATRGDFVVIGDIMKSLTLLVYKGEEGALELRARDYGPAWTTGVEVLDDDTYIASEQSGNLYVVRKNSEAASDEERARLDVVGRIHLSHSINVMRHGSLVMRLPDAELASVPTLLYGSVEGAIGVIATLPRDLFIFLSKLQDCLRKVIKGVGGFDHAEWRAFSTERGTFECTSFIDGDLIEQYLDLSNEQMAGVVADLGLGLSVEEVSRRVEELARLH